MKLHDILTPTLTLPHQGGGEKADFLIGKIFLKQNNST
jgi:hypothetical protein